MIPQVEVFADCDLVHTSYVFTGLIDLANSGRIDLSVRIPWSECATYRGRFTVLFRLRERKDTAPPSYGCVDVHDLSSYFSMRSLEQCAFYFKSNFNLDAVSKLPESLRKKVRPFGPYFAVRTIRDKFKGKRVVGSALSLVSKHGPGTMFASRQGLYRLRAGTIGRWQRYKGRLEIGEYEHAYLEFKNPTIFFNPGCWPEKDSSTREVNQLRAEVIRALKKEFGPQFWGGFVRSAQAEACYKDCISEDSYTHRTYVDAVRSSLICVYTNGLDGCISWKLGEYLAAATCIVAEPLQNELAAPLVNGRDIFVFRSV